MKTRAAVALEAGKKLEVMEVNLDGPKRGDRVAFGADQMVDWTVTLDGRAYGHFGARAMLPLMDEDQAAQISAVLSTDPLPAGW